MLFHLLMGLVAVLFFKCIFFPSFLPFIPQPYLTDILLALLAGYVWHLRCRLPDLRLDNTKPTTLESSSEKAYGFPPHIPLTLPDEPDEKEEKLEQTNSKILDVPPDAPQVAAPPLPSAETPIGHKTEQIEKKEPFQWFSPLMITRLGILIFILGVTFMMKYSIERKLLSIEIRLVLATLFSFVLLLSGWYVRKTRLAYSVLLQGGGVGLLYLTTFMAHVFSILKEAPLLTGALLATSCLFSVMLALLQNTQGLAVFGVLGGFIAPVLIKVGTENYMGLYSFFTFLNLSVLAMVIRRPWQALHLAGFILTFSVGSFLAIYAYTAELFYPTEFFFLCSFLIYFSIPVIQQKIAALSDTSDLLKTGDQESIQNIQNILVWSLPMILVTLQNVLLETATGRLWNTVCFGSFYLFVSQWLWRSSRQRFRVLIEAYLPIGIFFLTLAVYFCFSGTSCIAIWALEGVALFWVGAHHRRKLFCWGGLLLQGISFYFFLIDSFFTSRHKLTPFLNPLFFQVLLLTLCQYLIAFRFSRENPTSPFFYGWEKLLSRLFLIIGTLFWLLGGNHEIRQIQMEWQPSSAHFLQRETLNALFFSASFFISYQIGCLVNWKDLCKLRLFLMPFVYVLVVPLFVVQLLSGHLSGHPLGNLGWLVWPMIFAMHYVALYQEEQCRQDIFRRWQHYLPLWLLSFFLFLELNYWVGQLSPSWEPIACLLAPTLGIFLCLRLHSLSRWPVKTHEEAYLKTGLIPLVLCLVYFFLQLMVEESGGPWPFIYLPFLNPFDLSQLFAFLTLFAWFIHLRRMDPHYISIKAASWMGFGLGFLGISFLLSRSLFHWGYVHSWPAGVWSIQALWNASMVQIVLTLFWGIISLGLMFFSSRFQWRMPWIAGASLLLGISVKLFLVDLWNSHGVNRIITFLGIGVLFLVIGYLAPIPVEEKLKK